MSSFYDNFPEGGRKGAEDITSALRLGGWGMTAIAAVLTRRSNNLLVFNKNIVVGHSHRFLKGLTGLPPSQLPAPDDPTVDALVAKYLAGGFTVPSAGIATVEAVAGHNVPPKKETAPQKQKREKFKKKRQKVKKKAEKKPVPPEFPPKLEPWMCRWQTHEAGRFGLFICGKTCQPARHYCAEHLTMSYKQNKITSKSSGKPQQEEAVVEKGTQEI